MNFTVKSTKSTKLFKDLQLGDTFKVVAEESNSLYKDIFYLKTEVKNALMFDTSEGKDSVVSCSFAENTKVIPVESELILYAKVE